MAKKQKIRFNVPTGTYALTGVAIGLNLGRSMSADVGNYAITGNAVQLTKLNATVITTDFGSYGVTGFDAGLNIDYTFTVPSGSYTITGNDVGLTATITPSMAAEPGTYGITGNDVTLTITAAGANYTLEAESGNYALSFVAPNFITVGPNTRARVGVVGQFAIGQQTAHHVAHAVENVIPPNTGGGGDPLPWQERQPEPWEQEDQHEERNKPLLKQIKKKKKPKKPNRQAKAEPPAPPLFERDFPPKPGKPIPEAPPAKLGRAYGPLADDEALVVPPEAHAAPEFDPWQMPGWFDQDQNDARAQRAAMKREAEDAQDIADIQAILELAF